MGGWVSERGWLTWVLFGDDSTHNTSECIPGTRQLGHNAAVRQIATHRTLPLTASRAQDGRAFVWNTSPSLVRWKRVRMWMW